VTSTPIPKSRGEVIEGVAFQFCKVATVAFILGRWTLPVASGLAAGLYLWAFFSGKKDTRCVLRYPLVIAAFWAVVSAASVWMMLHPEIWQRLFSGLRI